MKGFTLIETLIAITVLMLIIIGPLSLAVKSISASIISQNQITAFYLGQEAVEYMINLRDNNFLQGEDWLKDMNPCQSANGCYVDIPNDSINGCPANCQNIKIKYDENNSSYNYSSGHDTVFTRIVKIENVPGNNDEVKIEIVVSWSEKFGGPKSFTLQREIFDWK